MTRITAINGDRTLVQISDDLWISQCFIKQGLVTREGIEQNYKKEEYQISKLLAEYNSDIIGKRFRRWNIDGKYFTVFEDGTFYNSEELHKLSENKIKDESFRQLHLLKNIFKGEVADIETITPEFTTKESTTQEELIF